MNPEVLNLYEDYVESRLKNMKTSYIPKDFLREFTISLVYMFPSQKHIENTIACIDLIASDDHLKSKCNDLFDILRAKGIL
jgi:hypothetical protein